MTATVNSHILMSLSHSASSDQEDQRQQAKNNMLLDQNLLTDEN